MPKNGEQAQDSRPPSRKIADDLREAIERGDLVAGQKVPSERELARRYGAARNTAREAIRLLSEDGLLLAQHGRGVFVRPAPPLIRFGNDRYSPRHKETGLSPFLMECAKQGKIGCFEVLSIERIVPPPAVADRLQVPADMASVLRRENVFWADDDPVQRVTTYVPWELAEGTDLLTEEVGHPYGIHGIFEDQGHVMTRIREEVSARMPHPDERRDLRLPPGVPVLDVLHTSLDQQGQPYELTRLVMRTDLTGLLYDTPVE